MAIPDGKPATDFSAMNREWVRAVAEEAAGGGGGGGGIPAPENPSDGDVLTYSSTDSAWVAAAPGGGGGSLYVININDTTHTLDKTFAEIYAAFLAGNILVIKRTIPAEGEYGEELVFLYVIGITRDFDLQGAGAGGVVVDMNNSSYAAAADTDYPVVEM